MGRHTQIWRGRIASSESQASPEQARGPLPPPPPSPPPPGVKVSFAMSHVIYCWPLCPQYRSQSLLFWPTPNPKRVKDSQVVISHVPTQRPKDPKTYKLWLSATGTQTHTERAHKPVRCVHRLKLSFYFQIIPHALAKHTICVPTQAP